ncbi:MAG: ABC transporter ATP-binding protein [Holosporales bacterium]|nr:ABC transporter ATP-binding protein [Holosporales bacterium]
MNGLVNSYLMKVIIDALTYIEGKTFSYKTVLWPAVFIVLNFELNNLSWRGINYINLRIAPLVRNKLISQAFEYIHLQSMHFFQESLSGSISNNITMLADNVEEIASRILPRLIRGIVHMVIALIATYFVNPLFSIALFVWAGAFTGVSLFFAKKIRSLADSWTKSQSQVSGHIVDSVMNFSSVKLFSQSQFELSLLQNSLNVMKQKFQTKEKFFLKFYFLQGLSVTCLVAYAVYLLIQLRMSNQVTIGDFAFILGMLLYFTENVWDFTEQIDILNKAVGKCNHSLKALYQPIEILDNPNANPLRIKEGKIKFENASFHYKQATPLFQHKSIEILPGQKVGLVGYSGSGKSTFVNLLMRLYDVIEGQILIDGQNIQLVTQESLHKAIVMIPQDPSLFHRSIKENILYGNPKATDKEVIEAARKANAHGFIMKLPQAYESHVGERGVKLSGGQRQRIAIARAILRNSPILVLDEATSQLDSVTENMIQGSLEELIKDRTTLIIAHRLSTVLHMDRILVFDKGCIVEDGSHNELLALNGIYKKLWDAQVGGFLPTTEVA